MTTPSSPRPQIGRRKFLAMGGAAAAAGLTVTSLPLALMPDAAAQGESRSLVCVMLSGGADSFNMYMPLANDVPGQDYATYRDTRTIFAVDAAQMLPVGDGAFGLHPLLTNLSRISNANQLAIVRNVGTLARPTTKADFLNGVALPQSLFAHNAQRKLWQNGGVTTTSDNGWGAAIVNGVAPGAPVAPSFSIQGSNTWQASGTGRYARLAPNIAIQRLAGYDPAIWNWFDSLDGVAPALMTAINDAAGSTNRLDQAASRIMQASIATTDALQSATEASAENEVGMDDVGGNELGLQLRKVARIIKNRERLGMPRQVFFVRTDGWDTHNFQDEVAPQLFGDLNVALGSFHDSMESLGLSDTVTTFTMSDFGRTLTTNGAGTDHGWGGNSFVMGGAVNGGEYGTFPSMASVNNPDDISENTEDFAGRLIPTTSVAQYGATLARWMGLGEAQLDASLPQLRNFTNRNLGFMTA